MTTEETVTVTAVFKAEDIGGDSSTGTVQSSSEMSNDPPYLNPATSLSGDHAGGYRGQRQRGRD